MNWTRRQALERGTIGLTAGIMAHDLSVATAAEAAPENGDAAGWIDAHVHVWTPDVDRYPLAAGFQPADMQPPSFTPQELMAHARPCQVARVVLIQMSYYGADNRYMLDVIQQQPDVYRGVAIVDEDQQPARAMQELAKQGVRGFRIQPRGRAADQWLRGEGMVAMWRCAADHGLAMCHLLDPNYLPSVADACRRFPQTPVVIDHFGRIGIDGQIRDSDLDALCRLADFESVSVKVSAFYALGNKQVPYTDLAEMIRRVLSAFGKERLMWASDCPFQVQGQHTYRASLDLIASGLSFLTEEDREWLLRKTAARVFWS